MKTYARQHCGRAWAPFAIESDVAAKILDAVEEQLPRPHVSLMSAYPVSFCPWTGSTMEGVLLCKGERWTPVRVFRWRRGPWARQDLLAEGIMDPALQTKHRSRQKLSPMLNAWWSHDATTQPAPTAARSRGGPTSADNLSFSATNSKLWRGIATLSI